MNPCVTLTAANDGVCRVPSVTGRPLAAAMATTARSLSRETLPIFASPVGSVFGGRIIAAEGSATRHRSARGASNAGMPSLAFYGTQKFSKAKQSVARESNHQGYCALPKFVVPSDLALCTVHRMPYAGHVPSGCSPLGRDMARAPAVVRKTNSETSAISEFAREPNQ